MSISDGLGPSIFCRKMEKARPMREEMDGKVVYLLPESALLPLMLYFSTVIFPICTLTWRVNNYVSRQEKVYIEQTKVEKEKVAELFEAFQENISQSSESFQERFPKLLRTVSNLLQNECTINFD